MDVPATVTVEEIGLDRRAAWDAYVHGHSDGTVYHLAAWKPVFERAFGQRVHLLAAVRGGVIVGALPLLHMKGLLFGNALVSMGHLVYGGPLADDAEGLQALDRAAIDLAETLKADRLEYRSRCRQHPDWPTTGGRYATFRKSLLPDADANLKAIPRKQRAVIRKAIRTGLTSAPARDIDDLYYLMALSYRNLGTPSYPRRYFRILQEELGPVCETLVIRHEGAPVAAVMSFFFRDEVLPYYGGGGPAARGLGANDFMYWEVMRRACEQGYRVFDFGRSKVGTGAYNFKKYWGFEPAPLEYEFHLRRGGEVPDRSPLNPKYKMAIAVWRRLPLWLSMRAGPLLSKHLG